MNATWADHRPGWTEHFDGDKTSVRVFKAAFVRPGTGLGHLVEMVYLSEDVDEALDRAEEMLAGSGAEVVA